MENTEKIKLNLNVLNENSNTFVSVTDLYNVNIFTDSNMEEFYKNRNRAEQYYRDINQNIFIKERELKEDSLQTDLFAEEMIIAKRKELTGESLGSNFSNSFIVIMVSLVFGLIIIRYNLYRAIRRRKDAD